MAESSTEVLKFLEPGEVEKIGAHMVSMSDIPPDTVDDALAELFAAVNKHKALDVDSEEYVRDIFCKAFGDDKAKIMIDRMAVGGKGRGINQLYGLDARSIADLLRAEHPQVAANVLSLLEGERAAYVLLCLPEDFRADVLMRIASLEGVSLAALRELDEILEEQLAGNENIRSSSVGGIHVAANILNRLEGPVSSDLLDEIAENSPELAQKIQNKMYVCEDIINLDNKGMQTLLREIGSVVPHTDNFFAALNSAVFTDGSFVYIPKGVRCPMELSTYFRINAANTGQFERTLIIADEGAQVHYVEGCTAPIYTTDSFHSGVIEIVVKKGARVRYTTIQNWSTNVYNLVTQRAMVHEDATMEWVDANLGSKLTMKYPSCYLIGPRAHGEILSMAFAGPGQHQDAGGKVVHVAPHTSSKVTSKSISRGTGKQARILSFPTVSTFEFRGGEKAQLFRSPLGRFVRRHHH